MWPGLASVAIVKKATFARECDMWGNLPRDCAFGAGAGIVSRVPDRDGTETGRKMLFWLVAATLVAGAAAWLVYAARAGLPAPSANPDLGVYRAQLAELERDCARGVIAEADAAPIRAEIARRILDSDRRARAAGPGAARDGGAIVPLAVTGVALLAAVGLYLWLGAPGYPDLPHADRLARAESLKAARPTQAEAEAIATKARPAPAPPPADIAALMDKLRAAVAARPTDIQGLTLLARNERSLGNLSAAARAQTQLVAALGAKAAADDLAALADVLVNAAGGIVTAEAEAALTRTLALDPKNGTARFYAGLLEAQVGRPDIAFRLWQALLSDGPPDAPWVAYIEAEMPILAEAAGTDYVPPVKGPGAADMAAAAGMSDADRAAMIQTMVAGLEDRLTTKGGTPQEWAQLMTALGVLGDHDRATAALARATAALAGNPDGLAQVQAAARAAGFGP